jgi:hypothetical protein
LGLRWRDRSWCGRLDDFVRRRSGSVFSGGFSGCGFLRGSFPRRGFSRRGFSRRGFPGGGFHGRARYGFFCGGFSRGGFFCGGFSRRGFSRGSFSRRGFSRGSFSRRGFPGGGFPGRPRCNFLCGGFLRRVLRRPFARHVVGSGDFQSLAKHSRRHIIREHVQCSAGHRLSSAEILNRERLFELIGGRFQLRTRGVELALGVLQQSGH